MLKRAKLFAMLTMLTLVTYAARGEDASAPTDCAAYFPQDTILFIKADMSEAKRKLCAATALGKILKSPEMRDFLQEPRARLNRLMAGLDRLSQFKTADLRACMKQQVGIGVVLRDKELSLLIAGRITDQAAAQRIHDHLPEFLQKSGIGVKPHPTDKSHGVRACVLGPVLLSCAIKNNFLLLAVDNTHGATSANGRVISSILSLPPGQCLASMPEFTGTLKHLGRNPCSMAFMNPAPIWRLLRHERASDPDLRKAIPVMQALGIFNLAAIGRSTTPTPPGFTTRAFVQVKDMHAGLFGLLVNQPVSKDLLGVIPADARFASLIRLDLGQVMNLVRTAATASGMPEERLDQLMQRINAQMGFNPETDLVRNLADEAACMLVNPENVGGMPLMGLNGLAFVVRVKDRAPVERVLGSLCMIGGMLAKNSSTGGDLLKLAYKGHQLTGVKVASGLIAPCFTITDKFLIIATGPSTVKHVLDTISGKHPNLAANPDFQATMKKLGISTLPGVGFAARPRISMPGSDIATISMMSGLLLPALSRARNAARSAKCMNNLRQIGLGITMYSGDTYYGKMPKTLKDLWAGGEGIVGDKHAFICPESHNGFHYVQGLPKSASPLSIVAFDARGSHARGRNVLFRDCHIENLPESVFQARLKSCLDRLKANGHQVRILPPWIPPGMQAPANSNQVTHGPLAFIANAKKNPAAFIRELLSTFQLYRLPPARVFNRNLFASGNGMQLLSNGIACKGYGPFPFANGMGRSDASGLMSGGSMAMPAIIAAIAIPNLLESRMQANEINAIAALKCYATAQATFKKANYAQAAGLRPKVYCPDFRRLGGPAAYKKASGARLELIPGAFAMADSPNRGYQGYYFINDPNIRNGLYEFGLYAVPCVYDKTGINTYYIDTKGTVFMKDLGGKVPGKGGGAYRRGDNTWVVP